MQAPSLRSAGLGRRKEEEKIFTGVVDTWRVGKNQQYLYSSGKYLIFVWLFQRKKGACRGILTAQDSSRREARVCLSPLGLWVAQAQVRTAHESSVVHEPSGFEPGSSLTDQRTRADSILLAMAGS